MKIRIALHIKLLGKKKKKNNPIKKMLKKETMG
jgi:hypothetical protein